MGNTQRFTGTYPLRKIHHRYPPPTTETELIRGLLDASVDVVFRFRFRPHEHYEYISPSIVNFIGLTAEDVYRDNRAIYHATLPEDRHFILELENPISDPSFRVMRFLHPDGHLVRARVFFRQILDAEGNVAAVDGVVQDITSWVTAEEDLSRLIENNPLPAAVATIAEGRMVAANESLLILFGYTHEEFIGHTSIELNLWSDPQMRAGMVQEVLAHQSIHNREYRFNRHDGKLLTCLLTGVKIDYQGIPCTISLLVDITERKSREELLLENEERFRYIIHHDYNGILVLDSQEQVLFVSDRFIQDFHLQNGPSIGRPVTEAFPEVAGRWRDIFPRVLSGAVESSAEDSLTGPEGQIEYFRWECRPWQVNPGDIGGLILYSEIITQRKERENHLEAIAAVTEALRLAVVQEEIFPILLDQAQSILKTEASAIILRRPTVNPENSGEESPWQIRLANGRWANLTGREVAISVALPGEIRATRQPFVDNQASPLGGERTTPFFAGTRTLAAAPLFTEGGLFGALWIGRENRIGAGETQTLASLANIAANALQRAWLHEETSLHLRRLTTLRAIDQAISASLDLRVALSILVNQITIQLRIDAALVLLYNPVTQSLSFATGRNLDIPHFRDLHLRLGESQAGKIALTRQAEYVTDVRTLDPKFAPWLIQIGFVTYIGLPLVAKGRIKGVLELFHRSRIEPSPEWLDFLNAVAAQAAIAIDNAELFDQLQGANTQLNLAYDASIESWSRALELRKIETSAHTRRVTRLCLDLARRMYLDDSILIHLQRGALLHDVGLLCVPDAILFKPGALDAEEWELMRQHPRYADELLKPIPQLKPALDIPLHHHECWDGSGYPDGLRGESIPLPARIFAVVNAWDELTHGTLDPGSALNVLQQESGRKFDPQVVKAFIELYRAGELPEFEAD